MLTRRRAETSTSTWIAIGLAIVLVLAIAGYITIPGANVTNVSTKPGQTSITKPLSIGCTDPVAAANCGAVTVALYQGSSTTLLETLTATSSGVATSTNSYSTGTALTMKVSGNSKVTEFIPVSLPGGYITDTNIIVSVYAVTLGAWTQTYAGTGGTTFTSGNTYSFGQFSGNQVTITGTISETTSNAGYKTSYDIVNLMWQNWLIQIDDGGGASSNTQYATVVGLPNLKAVSLTNYYFIACPDGLSGSGTGSAYTVAVGSNSAGTFDSACAGGALTQMSSGNVVTGGSAGFSFTLKVGSLTGANTETFSFKMYYYASAAYFAANGNLGPSKTQSGSTFTILFHS